MDYGLRVWDGTGQLTFDSTDQGGGVVAGYYTFAAGASGFLSFPLFTGAGVDTIPVASSSGGLSSADDGVATSVASGYPTVLVSSRGFPRAFLVILW